MTTTTTLAQETARTYVAQLDEYAPHKQNVASLLRDPIRSLTLQLLEKKALDTSAQARLEAFLEGVALAMPSEEVPEKPKKKELHQSISLIRSISSLTLVSSPQISQQDLLTRLLLYVRAVQQSNESVRSTKVRALALVSSFVETVSTVQEQGPLLTRLLQCMTQEVLAVSVLGPQVQAAIRRLVSNYEHSTSFASLAFLSSPDSAAEDKLLPLVVQYLKYLRIHQTLLRDDCELESMLQDCLHPELRYTFKHGEFRSIGHLLEVCQAFRPELQEIPLSRQEDLSQEKIQQALIDMRREIISVNGRVLPPVHSRKDLVRVLAQTLQAATLATTTTKKQTDGSDSGYDTDQSQRKFQVSTINSLVKRLLIAGCRTGNGGDAFFVVRDLFGGDDVQVVPSRRSRDSIEMLVRLTSITMLCHASFNVVPSHLVGTSSEPLVQVRTTTQETIFLKEVRVEEGSDFVDGLQTEVQEVITKRTGERTLSVRPALYEKVEEFNTPS